MAVKTPEKTGSISPNGLRFTLSPQQYQAVIFDMDGVVTQTAKVHAAAWKTLFDDLLKHDAEQHHQTFKPFDIEHDYLEYVDGKKREDGLISFLESRGIELPMGHAEDPPDKETVFGLSKRKEALFLAHLNQDGVQVYDSTISLIKTLRENHVKTAIISASRNCEMVLKKAGVLDLFDTRVDGIVAEKLKLPGKPKPDIFLEAARRLNVPPEKAVVVEDAIAGVQAGHAGGFGLVIGVNRSKHAAELKKQGADVVVNDLSQVIFSQNKDSCVHHSNLQDTESNIDDWNLIYNRYSPEEEGRRETLCALGNGYFVTRAADIGAQDDAVHYPGTYLAGGYNRLISDIQEKSIENEALVNFPNWLVLKFKINQDDWFSLDNTQIVSFQQRLNLKEGVLYRDIHFRDQHGQETKLHERRLVHMGKAHYAALELTLTPLNWSGILTIHSALDGTVINNNIKKSGDLKKKHLNALETKLLEPETLFLKVETSQSHLEMVQAARTRLYLQEKTISCKRKTLQQSGYIGQEMSLDIQQQQSIRVEKILTLFTSKDNAISECGLETQKWIAEASDFKTLYEAHIGIWKHLWERFDISMDLRTLPLKKRASLALRLHVFHLLQSLSYQSLDRDIGVPARGWHGEGYQGHIFWDNILVFRYLNMQLPNLTASLLKYRYRRLDAARYLAKQAGYKGAMFPWQSGSDGDEETPMTYPLSGTTKWIADASHLQRHVNAAIVYNIWQYYQVSGDLDFMFSYGAEIILEVARFWASIAKYNPEIDKYEISGIVGPDEYHDRFPINSYKPGIRNNAYTNIMAAWVLCRALDVLKLMPKDYRDTLIDKISLKDEEFQQWNNISRKMRVVFQNDDIISQFEGFETLPELDWEKYRREQVNLQHIDMILSKAGDTTNRYKVLKQADVLMLFYLFSYDELHQLFQWMGYTFPKEAITKNIEYYAQRTAHGSTLSRVVYSWVLARSDRSRSLDLFIEAFESDLNDIQGGTTPEGIHLGAMAGTLDIVQRCYTGLIMKEDTLWFNPRLPKKIQHIDFTIHYRFHCLKIHLTQETLQISALPSVAQNIQIGFDGKIQVLEAGQQLEFNLID
jgi:beta-phosphoglucomutase family hydrolase